ncbi:MAG: hypothetical protein ACRDK8_12650 [Solirubrobacteraceae bacterium]
MGERRDPGRYVLRNRYRAGGPRRGAESAAEEDSVAPTGLRALRWLAEEDVVYEPETETLHRPDCQRLLSPEAAQALSAGSALDRVNAPRICECRPDVTLQLGTAWCDADERYRSGRSRARRACIS